MEYLKSIRLRYLSIIFIFLYMVLWALEPRQARQIFYEVTETGKTVSGWTLNVASYVLKNLYLRIQIFSAHHPTSTVSPPAPDSSLPSLNFITSSQTHELQTFLSSYNEDLAEARGGFYDKHPGYYIEVNTDRGTCQARYDKNIEGRWETPARILCPQVKVLLGKENFTIRR